MRIKADWPVYLHDLRQRQADIVFHNCPEERFDNALELGAGDGFLSQILAKHAKHLLCTEINEARLSQIDEPNVQYMILDAEKAGESFETNTFDFIFSSSLLEHLPEVNKALEGMHRVLTDDGIAVHVLPNRIWKTTTVFCHIPNKIVRTVDKFLAGRLFKRRLGHKLGQAYKTKYGGNNQKIGPQKQCRLTKPFLPPIHGISGNTVEEFLAFGKRTWMRRFEEVGFEVVAIKKMPFNSGYGFGFRRISHLMDRLGVSSGAAFVLRKKGHQSRHEEIWSP